MIRITVYAGPGQDETPSTHDWSECGPEEALRQIGLEYKQADYFWTRQVIIVLDPVEDETNLAAVREKVRDAAISLENTGLL